MYRHAERADRFLLKIDIDFVVDYLLDLWPVATLRFRLFSFTTRHDVEARLVMIFDDWAIFLRRRAEYFRGTTPRFPRADISRKRPQ